LALIDDLNDILIKPERVINIIEEELSEIRQKF
jgi:DNA gyrase/topoisomerase IV subunit A